MDRVPTDIIKHELSQYLDPKSKLNLKLTSREYNSLLPKMSREDLVDYCANELDKLFHKRFPDLKDENNKQIFDGKFFKNNHSGKEQNDTGIENNFYFEFVKENVSVFIQSRHSTKHLFSGSIVGFIDDYDGYWQRSFTVTEETLNMFKFIVDYYK